VFMAVLSEESKMLGRDRECVHDQGISWERREELFERLAL